jgi:uncharacterized protein
MSEIARSKPTIDTTTGQASAAKSLLVFVLVTFSFTWLVLAPAALSVYGFISLPVPINAIITLATLGPFLGGISAAAYETGPAGVRALLSRVVRWRVKATWYGLVLAGPALVMLAAFLLWRSLGGPQLPAPPAQAWLTIPILILVLLLPALFEETGWRGFALPRLQGRYGALVASIAIGIIWAAWHAPIWLIPEAGFNSLPFSTFAVFTVALSILFTWLFNNTGGSVMLPALAHAAINAYPQPWNSAVYLLDEGNRGMHLQIPVTIVLVVLASTLVLLVRGQKPNALSE